MAKRKRPAKPFPLRKCEPRCYACDATGSAGYRDRRPEGGVIEHACSRHADPYVDAAVGPDGTLVRVNTPIERIIK